MVATVVREVGKGENAITVRGVDSSGSTSAFGNEISC